MTSIPLVIDLDGTLINTDMLHESAIGTFRNRPLDIIKYPFWLIKGKAALKQNLANRSSIDPATLPYNTALLSWLEKQKANGRKLILCSASDNNIVQSISDHLKIFDEVIASNGTTNVAGENKAKELESRFGRAGYDYAANDTVDLSVWRSARNAIVVNASRSLLDKVKLICNVEEVFPASAITISEWRRALRIHQWLKNVLLFIPIIAAHQLDNPAIWLSLVLAFLSFSFCASAVYIANDLFDLDSDRNHPRKKTRPFAAGTIPIWMGVCAAPLLILVSIFLGVYVGESFLMWLGVYFVLTCIYSLGIKKIIIIDCLALAILYTLRIVAGAAAADNLLSFWLLAFSIFLFLSLAFVKRYAELEIQLLGGNIKIQGRGYLTSDSPLVQSMGIVSGYASALVLALYLNSDAVVQLYKIPEIIWAAVPILLFWISWMWIHAHRGEMHDDPLVFAVKDKISLLTALIFASVIAIGWVGLPW